jgi:hypothetical protein
MHHRLSVIAFALIAFVAFCAPTALAQDGTPLKLEAVLAAPSGATDTTPTGKAKTFYRAEGNGVLEKLTVTLQHLQRKTEYRIAINGTDLGVFTPKGNSGTVVLKFRDPAKGKQVGFPVGFPLTKDYQVIDVYEVAGGTLVMTGTFVPTPE